MLGCLSIIASIITAVAAGLGYFSFWWSLIPAFLAGSFALANSPGHHAAIVRANQEGRLSVFPIALLSTTGMMLAICGVAFWITRTIA